MKGFAELSLLVAVCMASWTRTPLGAAVEGVVDLARGEPTPDLLATFRTALPAGLQRSLEQGGEALLAGGLEPAESPERLEAGWTAAVRTAVSAHLGAEALAEVEALHLSDPAVALESWAVGEELRLRAVRRARAAGEAEPERFEAHRRFLPGDAAAEADRAVGETLALATVLDLAWPVGTQERISSPFGYRDHPTLKKKKLHEGVDIAVPTGTQVFAVGAGKVRRSRFDKVNGNYVSIDHGHGVRSAYCHGDVLQVSKGEQVSRGQHVMDSGSTGRSTGPHLHFGLRINGRPVDPAPFRANGAAADLVAASSPSESEGG